MAAKEVTMKARLLQKLDDRSACLGIVGLGYVGLPLAVEMGREGLKVLGGIPCDRLRRE